MRRALANRPKFRLLRRCAVGNVTASTYGADDMPTYRRISENEYDVLNELAACDRARQRVLDHEPGWARPMDVGGSDGSHHSKTLAALYRRGYAERARRSAFGTRGSWLYKVTALGYATLHNERQRRGRP